MIKCPSEKPATYAEQCKLHICVTYDTQFISQICRHAVHSLEDSIVKCLIEKKIDPQKLLSKLILQFVKFVC